jgi:uncharacterized protein (DUF1501 family)
MIGGIPISVAKPLRFANFLNGDSDRILVLIQLNGGNDGLNTVMQLDNYDALANLRSNILIPANQLLNLSNTHALHPSMTGIRDLYDQGMVNIVQNVGYANQNRSHFRSTDIWSTGSDYDEFLDTGWVGRYLQDEFPTYPEQFPNEDCPDPLAITIGNFVSETCQGQATNYSIAVGDIDQIRSLDNPDTSNLPDNCYGQEMEFLIESIQKTNAYASRLTQAADAGTNVSDAYLDGDRFAAQMMTTARLISGGLKSKVYIVSIGGFDTHAAQAEAENPTIGIHADLWNSVSGAVSAFFDDMGQQGLADKIVCMTFSEFGRQIKSNASLGTDHGSAAPVLIFGKCVEGGVIGDNIPIPNSVEPQAGVPMQFDFRDVYGTVLEKWFDVDEDKVKQMLNENYQALNIFSDGCLVSAFNQPTIHENDVTLFPNPARDTIQIEFVKIDVQIISIELFNTLGGLLHHEIGNRRNQYTVQATMLNPGQYFIRIGTNRGFIVKGFVKI